LYEGKVIFRIDYGGESHLEINTTKRYNTGKWVNVEAAREFLPKRNTENGSLKVNNDDAHTGAPTKPVNSNLLPDLSEAMYYLGGVPPGFKTGTTKARKLKNK
jgi:laminin alpha 1/2